MSDGGIVFWRFWPNRRVTVWLILVSLTTGKVGKCSRKVPRRHFSRAVPDFTYGKWHQIRSDSDSSIGPEPSKNDTPIRHCRWGTFREHFSDFPVVNYTRFHRKVVLLLGKNHRKQSQNTWFSSTNMVIFYQIPLIRVNNHNFICFSWFWLQFWLKNHSKNIISITLLM